MAGRASWPFSFTRLILHSCCCLVLVLTQVCAEVAWSLLNRARFAVVDRRYLFERKGPLNFAEIEKSSVERPPLFPWPMTAEIPLSQTQTDLLVTCIEEYFLP